MHSFHQMCFWDDDAAARVIETVRWPNGVECHSCAGLGRVRSISGRTTVSGSFKCYACNRRFTVRTGSILEGSHIPLSRWMRAILLVACATKPVACKHLEESCGVAPRIARSLRQRLIQCLCEPIETLANDLETAALALRSESPADQDDRQMFADLCRSLGVPSESVDLPFLIAVRSVVGGGRRAPGPSATTDPVSGLLAPAAHRETWRESSRLPRCA